MKRELLLLIISLFLCKNIHADGDAAKKDTLKLPGWYPEAVVGLNISQIALSHWSQGGDNSLTWTTNFNGGVKYFSKSGWELRNSLKLSYGRTKIGGQNFRTNDNEMYFESVLSRHLGWSVDPFFSNSVRTPITTGFSYAQAVPVPISDFFDPAYVTQSFGFTYNKQTAIKTRLGIAAQETFVDKFRQYTNDTAITRDKAFKIEAGMEAVTNSEVTIAQNVKLQSSLRLFTTFESLDVWDIRWENVLIGKVNSFLNMNLSYLLIYQKDQSLNTQMKEGLNVGFTYAIL